MALRGRKCNPTCIILYSGNACRVAVGGTWIYEIYENPNVP
jgi:hypothetical protein